MKKIIFSHFYNEEFLLPFWLQHHKKIFDHGVLFDYDSSELSSEAKLTLDKQSRFLRVNSDLTFTIEGHCDERGTREYNLALGEKRATAVRDYLVIEGISPDRIRVISYGKEKPAVVGSNDMAWSKNRRAVTTID